MKDAERYPRFRAPQGNGEILCVPEWKSLNEVLDSNRKLIRSSNLDILGFSLHELQKLARTESLQASLNYLKSYTDFPFKPSADSPLVMTGHQPELFHPGVWLKNFAAAKLADMFGGTSLNLIIDSDICRTTSIKIPTGSLQDPHSANISFDHTSEPIPYEERQIIDPTQWGSFGDRCREQLLTQKEQLLLDSFWTQFAAAPKTKNLGYALAQARHLQELEWKTCNLDIPQSQVCQTSAFHIFSLHVLSNSARFCQAYNEALSAYRKEHKLRNLAQPMPDLSSQDEWIESPFWFWTAENPRRRPLYTHSQNAILHLSDLNGWQESICLQDKDSALESFKNLESEGAKIRTRALTTTLYSRLFLADLFIHGIGGAKYDQVTDKICENFFGIQLPTYLTISGTLRLPFDIKSKQQDSPGKIRQNIRDLKYHPEIFRDKAELSIESTEQFKAAEQNKQEWVKVIKNHSNAAERHQQINRANGKMRSLLQSVESKFQQDLALAQHTRRNNEVLLSREYSFCLFPQKELKNFLLDL